MIPAAILGLLNLVPSLPGLVRLVAGNDSKAAKIADTVAGVATAVTGKVTSDDALAALRADPALLERFLAGMKDHEEAWWAEETQRLGDVQTTSRAETASEDPFVRRMRPTWGYSMCLAFTTQMLGVTFNIFFRPGEVPAIVAALADLTMIWSVGMSVLGLYVWKRSSEKGVAGFDPLALLKRR